MGAEWCVLWLLVSFLYFPQTYAVGSVPRFMPMKIVDEVHSYGPVGAYRDEPPSDSRRPANFSGPGQFRLLDGRCFEYFDERYVWTLCPFRNMTQAAIPGSPHPFDGIIGFWREWIIDNFTFVGLRYDDGDICGDGSPRNVKVVLVCGNVGKMLHVEESEPCSYTVNFTTKLACGEGAMSVRNALDSNQLVQLIDLERNRHFYSPRGWERKLREFYVSAGFILPGSVRYTKTPAEKGDDIIQSRDGVVHRFVNGTFVPNFESLAECQLSLAALHVFQLKPLRERLRQLEGKSNG